MRLRFIPIAILMAVSAAAALPPLRPDQPLAPPVVGLVTPGSLETAGSVATDGHSYLVAWSDAYGRIRAARFSGDGTLIDGTSIPVDDTRFDTGVYFHVYLEPVKPNVFFTGHDYLIVYTVGNTSPPFDPRAYGHMPEVRVRRVATDGTLIDSAPRIIASGTIHGGAAFNGTFIGVFLADGNVVRLNPDGTLYGERMPAFFNSAQYPAALTASGDTFLAIAANYAVWVRTLGLGTTSSALYTNSYLQRLAAASNGTSTVVVLGVGSWDSFPPPNPSVAAFELRSTGFNPEMGPWKVIDRVSKRDTYPSIVADGDGYVVTWIRNPDKKLVAQRLTSDGSPVGQPSELMADRAFVSDVMSGGGHFIALTGLDTGPYYGKLQAVIFDSAGADTFIAKPSFTFSRVPRRQYAAAISSNGVNALVAWYESASDADGYVLRIAVIDGSGTMGPPIDITTAAPSAAPAVASNGSDFLLVWTEGQRVVARRIGANGQMLESAPIPLNIESTGSALRFDDPYTESPTIAVAWTGTDYLVAAGKDNGGEYAAVAYAHVIPDGRVGVEPLIDLGSVPLAQIAFDCDGVRCVLGVRRLSTPNGIPEQTFYGSISGLPVPNSSQRPEVRLDDTTTGHDVVAAQRGDTAAIFFSDQGSLFGSRMTTAGLPLDKQPVPLLTKPFVDFEPTPVAMLGKGLYWRQLTLGGQQLMRTAIDVTPSALISNETTEIDTVAPVAIAESNQRLFVIYRSMDLLFLRTYAPPAPHPGPQRRRSTR